MNMTVMAPRSKMWARGRKEMCLSFGPRDTPEPPMTMGYALVLATMLACVSMTPLGLPCEGEGRR